MPTPAEIKRYLADYAAWKAREAEEIARIRAKLGNPRWQPLSQNGGLWASNIGPPPAHPLTTTGTKP